MVKTFTIPVLKSNEVGLIEKSLGTGGFCTVSAVRWLKLNSQKLPSSSDTLEDARSSLSKQFDGYEEMHHSQKSSMLPGKNLKKVDPLTQKAPRVALKKIKSDLEEERYEIAVKDLVSEATILAKCSHRNIISLYAVGCDEDENTASSDIIPQKICFILIDQLKSTLRKKLSKWKDEKGNGPEIFKSKIKLDKLWIERLKVAKQVADALKYMHSKGFIHRDITPDNIGFTDDDAVKLFDFGLARSIGRDGKNDDSTGDGCVDGDNDQVFDLSSNTGTLRWVNAEFSEEEKVLLCVCVRFFLKLLFTFYFLRYMSPEVALGKPYGFKVDIYSFSLVMYEILNLTKPFSRLREPTAFTRMVIRDGFRPALDDSLPSTVRNLLKRMWSTDATERPSSNYVVAYLDELMQGDEFDLYPMGHFGWKKRFIEGCGEVVINQCN